MSETKHDSTKLDIYTMPLVRVSIEHGTEGLKHRLQHALGSVGLQKNGLIQESIALGLDLHKDNKRTYEPYGNHLLRVPIRLIEQFGIDDPTIIAAGPLHDSIEDHAIELSRRWLHERPVAVDPHLRRTMGYEALKLFAQQYDASDLADLVWNVSIPPRQPGVSKIQAYLDYTATVMKSADSRSRVLKHADFIDNVDTPIELENEQKRAYLDRKQIGAYPLHIAGIERIDSLVTGENREEVIAVLVHLQKEASTRIDLRGEGEITQNPNSLRSA